MFLLVPAHPGSPGQRAIKRLCACVCDCVFVFKKKTIGPNGVPKNVGK